MTTPLKSKPRLTVPLVGILEAVRTHGNQSRAAADLGCSEASAKKRIGSGGLDKRQVLAAGDVGELLADDRPASDDLLVPGNR